MCHQGFPRTTLPMEIMERSVIAQLPARACRARSGCPHTAVNIAFSGVPHTTPSRCDDIIVKMLAATRSPVSAFSDRYQDDHCIPSRSSMATPDLILQSAAVDKAGKPRLTCAYAVNTSLTDQRLKKLALPVFAPSAEKLESALRLTVTQ